MAILSIRLLGTFQVSRSGDPVAVLTEKARALLAYLVVEASQPHPRSVLAHLFWPNQPERTALHNLRQALVTLRQAIGDQEAEPPFLLITRQTIQFNPHSSCWLDVAAFERLLAPDQQPEQNQIERWGQAVNLYRGDFMAGFGLRDNVPFEEWLLVRREQHYRQALEAFEQLAGHYERQAEYKQALHYARMRIALSPWQEQAHRQVMRCLVQVGERNTALAQYHACRRLLQEELNVEPTEETTALYEQIRAGELSRASQTPPGETKESAIPFSRHNLPAQLTPFVGREKELVQVGDYLAGPDCRLLTLVGPGGIGKTRLALQAAQRVADAFRDGVYFIPLAALPKAELLSSALSDALGVSVDQLCGYLRPRKMLLILDNFERVLSDADLLVELLQAAPQVKIMATSQVQLNLQAEWLVRVGELPFPVTSHAQPRPLGGESGEWQDIQKDFSAVRLFVQRARQVEAGFALSPETGPGVVRLCQLVEGMPLGIELAAAQVAEFSPSALAHDVENDLERLATTRRDVPPRHRNLGALFDYSWALLEDTERALLRRLLAFQGEFDAEAAQATAGATPADLAALVGKSVLRRTSTGDYTMHRLWRQCAAKRLLPIGPNPK
jgi:predicted ATPase/DNA-binding SARP family transcriptional activator